MSIGSVQPRHWSAWGGTLMLLLLSLLGVLTLGYPFLFAWVDPTAAPRALNAPLVFALLGPALLVLLVAELSSARLNARMIAVLGILTALNAVLRLPAGPGDAPTFFFLIILTGYVYGPRFGFLHGVLTMFVSSLLTGGVWPGLPYQMFVCGWMGMSMGWVGLLFRPAAGSRREWALLVAAGYVWGLLFGALMNLQFWPFGPPGDIGWEPGLGLPETLRRYWSFYLLTSLAWDSTRAIGNVMLIAALGRPVVKELRRFHDRFQFTSAPVVHSASAERPHP